MMTNFGFNALSIASVAWMLAVASTGWAAGIESLIGWLMVASLAFGPPSLLLYFAQQLPLALSKTINRAGPRP